MKKALMLFLGLLFLVLTHTYVINAQTASSPLRYKVSLGVGLSGSEAMSLGFAKGAQVSCGIKMYEFGVSFHHAFSQTLAATKRHGLAFLNKGQEASVQISQGANDKRYEHTSANTSSVNLFAGLDVLKALRIQSPHNVTVGALCGIGVYDSSFIINKDESKTVDVRYGALWSYGARVSYEYMLTERVGAGFSATYDFPQQNFYGLANLVMLF